MNDASNENPWNIVRGVAIAHSYSGAAILDPYHPHGSDIQDGDDICRYDVKTEVDSDNVLRMLPLDATNSLWKRAAIDLMNVMTFFPTTVAGDTIYVANGELAVPEYHVENFFMSRYELRLNAGIVTDNIYWLDKEWRQNESSPVLMTAWRWRDPIKTGATNCD